MREAMAPRIIVPAHGEVESFLAANEGSSITAWLAAFDAFEAMAPRIIVPAHGEVGDGVLIPMHRGIMRTIQARAQALKAVGLSADEVAAAVRTEFETKHPTWRRINGVANAARVAYAETR